MIKMVRSEDYKLTILKQKNDSL